jgi:hypothetical protein
MSLDISKVINVSVLTPQRGILPYNQANILFLTSEIPSVIGYESGLVYDSYTAVASDFGSGSRTAQGASILYAQSPSFNSVGGALLVVPPVQVPATSASYTFPDLSEEVVLAFTSVTDGALTIKVDGVDSDISGLNFSNITSKDQIYELIISNLPFSLVGSIDLISGLLNIKTVDSGASHTLQIVEAPDGTDISGSLYFSNTDAMGINGADARGETSLEQLNRGLGLGYAGSVVIENQESITDTDLLQLSAVCELARKRFFVSISSPASIAYGGLAQRVLDSNYNHTRVLFNSNAAEAYKFRFAYASRGNAINFSGSNTTLTMNLKDLVGVVADSTIDSSRAAVLDTLGVDYIAYIAGIGKVFSNGANDYYDNVVNLDWFVGAIEVAGFNALATVLSKVPQTEQGVGMLKGVFSGICDQAVSNGYIEAGTWTSSDYFGNVGSFRTAIASRGYYIYSLPLSQQSVAEREERKAPLVQIAIKAAGAIHSVDVIISVNK